MVNNSLATDLMASDVVVCTGIGKSGKVAALAADLLQSVGCRALSMNAVDLLHGGINVMPQRHLCTVVFFTHSGFTQEILTAAHYVRENVKGVRIVFVTSISTIDDADYIVQYESRPEEHSAGTVPVNASIGQLMAIGSYITRIANLCTVEFLHRGHPKGNLARVYERIEDGQ